MEIIGTGLMLENLAKYAHAHCIGISTRLESATKTHAKLTSQRLVIAREKMMSLPQTKTGKMLVSWMTEKTAKLCVVLINTALPMNMRKNL